MMQRPAVLSFLLCAMLLAGCGGEAGAGSSGVRGRVVAGPSCPVVQEGSPCPPVPFEGEVQATEPGSGDVVASADTDEGGRFEISLDPGTYDLLAVSGSGFPGGRPSTVRVEADTFAQVTLTYDTGIR